MKAPSPDTVPQSDRAATACPSSTTAPITIFIGSGEASIIERKVLIYSLHKHTSRPLDIRVFNGTHDSLEHRGGIDAVSLPLPLKYRMGWTEFGLYRFLVPQLCGHAGKALYLDSDIICLSDIGELFDTPIGGRDFFARPIDPTGETPGWRTAVFLVDCARTRFDLEQIFREVDRGLYSHADFLEFSPRFMSVRPYEIGALDRTWNDLDSRDSHTKLIHYTDMYSQPWKFRGHRHAGLWFRYFREARAGGWVTEEDIELSVRRHYVRPALRHGFSLRRFLRNTRWGQAYKTRGT